MSLSKQIMDVFTSAEELLADAPKTIEVRGCIKWLNQAKGSLAQAGEFDSIQAVREHLSSDESVDESLLSTTPIETGVDELDTDVNVEKTTPFSAEDTERIFNGEQPLGNIEEAKESEE